MLNTRPYLLLLAAVLPGLTFAQGSSMATLATATVELREIDLTWPAEGVIEAVRQATLAAQVPGRV
ncbi:MAG: efflux RND transporter periplasmic adaptor subunit, partial [Betaproteobacteria bacterium]|nr:efflux RND transporter periplasmic adaptor subunit [Betaproteobacteria bacterium]